MALELKVQNCSVNFHPIKLAASVSLQQHIECAYAEHTHITPDVLQLNRIVFLSLWIESESTCLRCRSTFFIVVQTFGSHFFLFAQRSFSRAPTCTTIEWQSRRVFVHRNKYNIISENPSQLRVQYTHSHSTIGTWYTYRAYAHFSICVTIFPFFSIALCCSPLTHRLFLSLEFTHKAWEHCEFVRQ